ncbi:MAG: DUF3109 family protein [Chloroherpetonaceae bacterium]|nr:DUF3109 family protein [Chloroherpetonaceae bacterium]MCS7211746.1 DUF3109 family protein [Chloroherpetonaceae bacterium]MDW8019201.1 DUF3109 family protein [Chloroherpetonaceae bacterium]
MKSSPNQDVALVAIGEVLIEPDVLTAQFCCDVRICKGACCVSGEKGAPVLSKEIEQIEANLEAVKPFLPEKNLEVLSKKGIYEVYRGELYLQTVDGQECVFAKLEADGTARCMLEYAFEQGVSNFQKPISCHLYPIRVRARLGTDYLIYSQIPECEGGRVHGAALHKPLIEFVRPALERLYGKNWAEKLLRFAQSKHFNR